MPAVNREQHRAVIWVGLDVPCDEPGERAVDPNRPDPIDAAGLLREEPRPVDVDGEMRQNRGAVFEFVVLDHLAQVGLAQQRFELFPAERELRAYLRVFCQVCNAV